MIEESRSATLYNEAKKLFPGGVNSPVRAYDPHPFFTLKGAGSKIHDVDGRSYIDYCMAYGPLIFGHAPPRIIMAVANQLALGSLYGTPTELEVKLGAALTQAYPPMESLRLVNSGAEATMHALRLARGFTGRKKIVKFEGCYHGAHDSVLVKAGSSAAEPTTAGSLGVLEEVVENTVVVGYNDLEALERVLRTVGGEVAAVIIEPVMGNIGVVPPRKGYLKGVKALTEECGALLIFDEVITGFRLAFGGAQEFYGVKPDLTTLGKILGGGLPLAAFGGRREIMEHISPKGGVFQAGTYCGNPVSVTAALETLAILSKGREEIYPRLRRLGETFRRGISDILRDLKVEAQVNGLESMFQIFFTPHPVTDQASANLCDKGKFMRYQRELLKLGVFVPPSQFETCFLSTAHSKEDVKVTLEAVDTAIKTL